MGKCYRCGKKVRKLYLGLCLSCFKKEYSLLNEIPDVIKVKKCKVCGNYFYKSKSFSSIERCIEKILRDILSRKSEIESAEFRIVGNTIKLEYRVKHNGVSFKEKKNIQIKVKEFVCNRCQKKLAEYFEMKIQLRGNIPPGILEEIDEFLEGKERKDAYISKIEELKEGIDIYLPSKPIGQQLVHYLRKKYKVKVLRTRKLQGLKDGIKFYKDTIVVRFYE